MGGFLKVFFCVFTLLVLSKYTCSQNESQNRDIEEKVTYNGDQVLRVETVNSKQRKTIKGLENQGCK